VELRNWRCPKCDRWIASQDMFENKTCRICKSKCLWAEYKDHSRSVDGVDEFVPSKRLVIEVDIKDKAASKILVGILRDTLLETRLDDCRPFTFRIYSVGEE
jgi:hypothetical protein